MMRSRVGSATACNKSGTAPMAVMVGRSYMRPPEYEQEPLYFRPMLPSILLAAALIASPPAAPDTVHLVVVATTDVHGRAFAWDYTADRPFPGGLTRVATVVDSLRRAYPGQVVVVDAGDLIQGDPFAAYFATVAPRDTNPVVRAMNLVGYDVATLGNHEFNWGLATLAGALHGASFPYVSANIRGLPRDTLVHPAYVMLEREGVKIGVTGFTTPGVMAVSYTHLRAHETPEH